MKKVSIKIIILLMASVMISSCASMNRTGKGAVVGTAAGGAMGAVI